MAGPGFSSCYNYDKTLTIMQDNPYGGLRIDQKGIFPHTAISQQKEFLSRPVPNLAKDYKQCFYQEPQPYGDEPKSS